MWWVSIRRRATVSLNLISYLSLEIQMMIQPNLLSIHSKDATQLLTPTRLRNLKRKCSWTGENRTLKTILKCHFISKSRTKGRGCLSHPPKTGEALEISQKLRFKLSLRNQISSNKMRKKLKKMLFNSLNPPLSSIAWTYSKLTSRQCSKKWKEPIMMTLNRITTMSWTQRKRDSRW